MPEPQVTSISKWFASVAMAAARCIVLLLACLYLFTANAFCQVVSRQTSSSPIRYLSDSEYPPYEFKESGISQGFAVDLINEIGKVTGRKVSIDLEPWNKVLPDLEAGKSDVASGVVTSERQKKFDFSLPMQQVHYVLFVRKGSAIRSMDDARGKSLLVENGDFVHTFLRKSHFTARITPVDSPLEELRLLNSGKFDGAFAVKTQGLYYIRKYGLENIEPSSAGFQNVEYAFIVSRDSPVLVRDINEGLEILKENGTFASLRQKWFGVYEETGFYDKARPLFVAVTISLALLILVLGWLSAVRHQVEVRTSELATEVRHRRAAEEELLAQRKELQDYIDRLTTLNAKIAPDGTLLKVNQTAAKLSGKNAAELIGEIIWEAPWFRHSEAIRNQIRDGFYAALRGESQRLESENVDTLGTVVQLDFSLTPVTDESGQVVAVIAEGRDVTSRRLAEIAYKESAEMLRTVLNTIPARVFWKDRDLVYRGANRWFAQDAGCSTDEIVGKTDLDIPWGLEEAEAYRADDRSVIDTGVAKIDFEEYQHRPDGSTRFLRTSKVPLRDAEGNIIGVLGSYEDITPSKIAEQALRDSERRLSSILNFLPDPTFAIDLEGRVTFWNQAMEELTGVSSDAIRGKGDHEYSQVIYGSRRHMIIDLVQNPGGAGESEFLNFRRNGSSITAEAHTPLVRPGGAYLWGKATTLYDSEGNVAGYIETLRDVTDRTLIQQALKESEQKFRAIAENAKALIFIIHDQKLLYTNPYFFQVLGYTEEELTGLEAFSLVHPDDREYIYKHHLFRLNGHSPTANTEIRLLPKKGGEVWVDISGTQVDYRGEAAVVGVGYDVTERRRTEEEKRAFYRETILSATDGKLSICDKDELTPYQADNPLSLEIEEPRQLADVRAKISAFCSEHSITGSRRDSFMIGVGEALDNALKHAGSGYASAGTDEGRLWVCVSDNGPGIGSLVLPKAVLRRGFSTKPSMGLGYSIILDVSDLVLLNTDREGTTVVLIKNLEESPKSLLDSIPDTWDAVSGLD